MIGRPQEEVDAGWTFRRREEPQDNSRRGERFGVELRSRALPNAPRPGIQSNLKVYLTKQP
jgi:hypothetical protein